MNNRLTLIFLIVLIPTISLNAQNPYYDALQLSKETDGTGKLNKNSRVASILDDYFQPETTNTPSQIYDAFDPTPVNPADPNPFIQFTSPAHSVLPFNSIASSIKSVGNTNVTNFVDGLAQFLVERTKQELSIAFFDKFKTALEDQEELKIIFPSTHRTLSAIGEEIYMYSGYIEMLRQSFQKDLSNMLPNLSTLLDSDTMKPVFEKLPELKIILSDGLYIASQLKSGSHIGDVFNQYVENKAKASELNSINANIYPSLKLMNILSQSLKSNSDKYWVTAEEVKKLKDEVTLKIFVGLVYQQINNTNKDLSIGGKKVLELLASWNQDINTLRTNIEGLLNPILEKGRIVEAQIENIKKLQQQSDTKPTYEDFYALSSTSIDFIKTIKHTYKIVSGNENDKFDNYITILESLGNIYVDINTKNYVSAVSTLAFTYQTQIIEKLDEGKLKDQHKNINSLLLKYGNFIAIVAKAETSEEVKKAIEAIALPVGSARIKRESAFNVSLNAYVGAFYGEEKLTNTTGIENERTPVSGITAPIGMAISKGGADCFISGFTVFISIIDIGAVTAYRFDSDNTEGLPEIKLEDIFAPGGHLYFNIRKSPLSIGGGYQLGPLTRKIEIDNNGSAMPKQVAAHRWQVGLVVDIPLINFHTTSK